jgi:hypothetical protein
MGQMVVVMATTEVTTAVPSVGQSVTSVPHLITVYTEVVKSVVVVMASRLTLSSPRRTSSMQSVEVSPRRKAGIIEATSGETDHPEQQKLYPQIQRLRGRLQVEATSWRSTAEGDVTS